MRLDDGVGGKNTRKRWEEASLCCLLYDAAASYGATDGLRGRVELQALFPVCFEFVGGEFARNRRKTLLYVPLPALEGPRNDAALLSCAEDGSLGGRVVSCGRKQREEVRKNNSRSVGSSRLDRAA
jgi:hypothetical protein